MFTGVKAYRRTMLVILLMFASGLAQTRSSSSDEYKKHMDDIQEAKDDLTDSIDSKNSKETIDKSKKLADLLHSDISYWKVRKVDQAAKLATASYDLAVQIDQQAQRNDFAAAHDTILQ